MALTLSEGAANSLSAVFTFNAEACLESYILEGHPEGTNLNLNIAYTYKKTA